MSPVRPTIHGEIMLNAWYTLRNPARESLVPLRHHVGTPPIT